MSVNLKQFKYVLTLASEGSFSKAADFLNIKQPSLSQYIKKIEQDVGMRLFDRTGGNVRLTDAGVAYIDIGRKILDLEHQLEVRFDDISSFKTGTITIGISAHRSVALMPGIVKAFQSKYPGIVIRIEERKRFEILEAAVKGAFDICLTTLPIDENMFSFETVMNEENVIAAPEKISLPCEKIKDRKFDAISVKTLDGSKFAMLNNEHPMQNELNLLCSKYNLHLKTSVVCTSLEALLAMVKNGVGLAFVPSCMCKPESGLRFYSVKEEMNSREIIILHRKQQYLSQAVKDLISLIKSELSR